MALIATIGLLIAIGVYIVVAKPFYKPTEVKQPRPANSVDYHAPSTAEQQAQQQQKDEIIKKQTDQSSTAPSSDNSTASTLTVTISRASQVSAGKPLNIRVIVDGTSNGECEVTLTKNGQPTIIKTFPIAFEATSSSCQGSDISADAFAVSGNWALNVLAKNGTAQSKPATQTVTVTK